MIKINKDKDIRFDVLVESTKLEDKGKSKWAVIEGVALETGMSRNGVDFSISNLKENDKEMFSVISGHQTDYDNPKHNVGEGDYSLVGEKLRYKMKVKNTSSNPDIIEQVMDGLLSVSIQGGYSGMKVIKEKGKVKKIVVEGLRIPILALVNKHVRGVKGATIESVIAERIEMNNKHIREVGNMEEKDVFAKQIAEKDSKIKEAEEGLEDEKSKAEEKDKTLKEAQEKIKEFEAEKKLSESKKHEDSVDKICETNKDLKKEELMKMSEGELKIVEKYETEKVNQSKDSTGSGVVNSISESVDAAKGSKEEMLDLKVLERFGDLTMSEKAYEEFNQEVKKRVLGED